MKRISYSITTHTNIIVEVSNAVAEFLEQCNIEEKRTKWRDKKRKNVSTITRIICNFFIDFIHRIIKCGVSIKASCSFQRTIQNANRTFGRIADFQKDIR